MWISRVWVWVLVSLTDGQVDEGKERNLETRDCLATLNLLVSQEEWIEDEKGRDEGAEDGRGEEGERDEG